MTEKKKEQPIMPIASRLYRWLFLALRYLASRELRHAATMHRHD
jgi:hypothetical protein